MGRGAEKEVSILREIEIQAPLESCDFEKHGIEDRLLVAAIDFTDENAIPIGTWLEAHRLAAPTDPKDTPYVAIALHHHAELWAEDAVLKTGLRSRGFTSFFEPK